MILNKKNNNNQGVFLELIVAASKTSCHLWAGMKHYLRCQISIYVQFSFVMESNIAYNLESKSIEFVL